MKMDGESSYESDISESWSLIDININEESHSVTVTPEVEKTLEIESKNGNSKKRSHLELKDLVEKCEEKHGTNIGPLNRIDPNSSSFANEGFVSCCNNRDGEGVHSSGKKNNDDGPDDSDDGESIEILDLDGNYRDSEVDRLDTVLDSHDSQTYQSDDEESVDESINNENRSNSSTVIKRKRKKFLKKSESPVNSVNSFSEDMSEKCDSRTDLIQPKIGSDESRKESCPGSGHPVYKHYKNNVATTALSLSVGVIFAGVACIAIGHFLGVQDAAEPPGELVEILKKLQVENAALQSRVLHLNRALLNQQANSKSALHGAAPGQAPCKVTQPVGVSKAPRTPANGPGLTEIRSPSLASVEWLSKLQNLVRSDNKDWENTIDLNSFGKYIHDQLNYVRNKKEGGVKLLEDADRKISKVLQKIVTRLSMSHENLENLYHSLTTLKDKLNRKLSKILPESPREFGEEKPKFERKEPVTELDLQSIRRNSDDKLEENSLREDSKSVVVYEFPKPEKYYQVEMVNLESAEGKPFAVTNSSEALTSGSSESAERKSKESNECEGAANKHKKRKKEKEGRDDVKEKRQKRTANKSAAKQTERGKRKKQKLFEAKPAKGDFEAKRTKYFKAKLKKTKKAKVKQSLVPKLKQNGKKRQSRPCSMHHWFNSTGFWVFRWADGRKEFRRHQALGDWQFERAKRREELRDEEYGVNWQFKRALGRESNREGGRWRPSRGTRFDGKEFFHYRFS